VKTVFDSSAFAKRYIAETGSEEVDALCRDTSRLGLSVLCVPEIISALTRRVHEEKLPPSAYDLAKSRLIDDVAGAIILYLTPAVIATAVRLLEDTSLRAVDALHVACALEWPADLFVTSDRAQQRAARLAGLNTRLV
jgi:uncharacterized protein